MATTSTSHTVLNTVASYTPPRRPSIAALYCAKFGHPISNQELFDINDETLQAVHTQDKTRELYTKLLLQRPSRSRNTVVPYREVATQGSYADKANRFREGSLAMLVETATGLLTNAHLEPEAIDILVVNYMAGKTLPSMAALLANKIAFRPDLLTYNLGDMGCSAGLISFDLAVRLLEGDRRPRRAMVIAFETVTSLFQQETHSPGGIVGNTLFGDGCAGVILSTTRNDPILYHIGPRQRVLKADDDGVNAITLTATETGPMIQLSKGIPEVAGDAIRQNLQRLVPQMLPVADKLRYVTTRKVPRWQKRIDYWALHPGGLKVLQGLERQLKLTEADLGASYRVFEERSNMSSPSIFYVLEHIERSSIRTGDRVLMLGFGSGFKVNSVVLTKGKGRHPVEPERNAVVIGGTSGIGLEAARLLQEAGYRVFIGSRRVRTAPDSFEHLDGAHYLPLDVTDPQSVQDFSDAVWERTFGVDALVVSSGISDDSRLMGRADAAQITRVIDTNLTGAIQVVNAFMPRMRQHSTIVLVNSILGQIPIMGSSVYCATKAGLRYFGEAVELEVQRSGRDIRLHSLYPAYVETPFLDHVRDTQGNLMLKPISPREAVAQLKHLFQNNGASSRRQADGFVLSRDRAIAAVYRYLPSAFKKIVTAL